jgi:hypothetical protein
MRRKSQHIQTSRSMRRSSATSETADSPLMAILSPRGETTSTMSGLAGPMSVTGASRITSPEFFGSRIRFKMDSDNLNSR